MEIRNRVKELVEIKGSELLPHPKNWRTHPTRQRDVLKGVLAEIGYANAVLAFVPDQYKKKPKKDQKVMLIDGHLRAETTPDTKIPVLIVDVNDEEAQKLLLSLDPIAALAGTNAELVKDLLKNIKFKADAVNAMISQLPGRAKKQKELPEGGDEKFSSIYQITEDVLFPYENQWDIPTLRGDMLATAVPQHVWTKGPIETPVNETLFLYGMVKIPEEAAHDGILGFFVWDDMFEVVWNEAVRFVKTMKKIGFGAVIQPDFSIWMDNPFAVNLFALYKAAWCARLWQEAGFKIIPNIAYATEKMDAAAVCGKPVGAPVVSFQCRTALATKRAQDAAAASIKWQLEYLKPESCAIYGGEEHRDWLKTFLPPKIKYIYLSSWTKIRYSKVMAKKGGVLWS